MASTSGGPPAGMTVASPMVDAARFTRAFYSRAEVARLLEVPSRTVGNWTRGYRYRAGSELRAAAPLVVPPGDGRWLSFVNLVEAHTVAAFRTCVSMQKLRPALAYLVEHLGVEHPLASRHLLTDGVELFFRYVRQEADGELIVLLNVSRGGQVAFHEIVEQYLHRVDWAEDGYASSLWLAGREAGLVVDPRRGFGQPIVARRGVQAEAVVRRLLAGESRASVAADFGLELAEVDAANALRSRLFPRVA